jgi:hypothetical protein
MKENWLVPLPIGGTQQLEIKYNLTNVIINQIIEIKSCSDI